MSKETRQSRIEKEEAIERLREWVKPGDTIYTILRHVSRSGMQRVIDLKVIEPDGAVLHIGSNVALALGNRYDRQKEGVIVSGGGMDMGFHLVYSLSFTLWPGGFFCVGESRRRSCFSSDHSTDRKDDYSPQRLHTDGWYALRQAWL